MEEQQDSALFNSGFAKLERIGQYKSIAHFARMEEDYQTWLNSLRILRSEMGSKFTKEEKTECRDVERKITNKLYQIIANKKKGMDRAVVMKLNQELDEYETILEGLEDKYKFGMPSGEYAGNVLG